MSDIKKSSISRRSSCYLLNLKQPEKTAKRLKLSFQRTYGTVRVLKTERILEAAVGFVDISEQGAGVFTPELLHKGSQIELCIVEPYVLKATGVVAWSIPVSSGIHGGKFRCRSGIQFVFDGEQSRFAVQEFVRQVALDPMESVRNSMAAAAAAAALMAPSAPLPVAAEPAASAAPGEQAASPAAGSETPVAADVPASEAVPPVAAEAPPEAVADATAPPAAEAAVPASDPAVPAEPENGEKAA